MFVINIIEKFKFVLICVCWRLVMLVWYFFFLFEYLLKICLVLSKMVVVFLFKLVSWVIILFEIFKVMDKVLIILFFVEVVIL